MCNAILCIVYVRKGISLYSSCEPIWRVMQKISSKKKNGFYLTNTNRLTLNHVLHPLRHAADKQFSIGWGQGYSQATWRGWWCGTSPGTTYSQPLPCGRGPSPARNDHSWRAAALSISLDHCWFTIQNIHTKKLARISPPQKKSWIRTAYKMNSEQRNFLHVF